jgi:hypothetical protein
VLLPIDHACAAASSSKSVAPPPTWAAASSSNMGATTKRARSAPTTQNADATAPAGKCRKAEHKSQDTASGAKPPREKRKIPSSSGAKPPTRRPRTSETDETVQTMQTPKPTLTAENWAELHEFDAWLQSPEAMHLRKGYIDKDRKLAKDLLAQPLRRLTLETTGAQLKELQKRQSLVSWHTRCVRAAYNFSEPGDKGASATCSLTMLPLALLTQSSQPRTRRKLLTT